MKAKNRRATAMKSLWERELEVERSPREKGGKKNRADLLESWDCGGIWRLKKNLSYLCPGLDFKVMVPGWCPSTSPK